MLRRRRPSQWRRPSKNGRTTTPRHGNAFSGRQSPSRRRRRRKRSRPAIRACIRGRSSHSSASTSSPRMRSTSTPETGKRRCTAARMAEARHRYRWVPAPSTLPPSARAWPSRLSPAPFRPAQRLQRAAGTGCRQPQPLGIPTRVSQCPEGTPTGAGGPPLPTSPSRPGGRTKQARAVRPLLTPQASAHTGTLTPPLAQCMLTPRTLALVALRS
mmetsp:Transcript_150479/g.262956  ORF Transcript_150479/g.262956 Transcript_150479/m.262956 type:complete len:214 (-) Transcript_150479:40-681(-)